LGEADFSERWRLASSIPAAGTIFQISVRLNSANGRAHASAAATIAEADGTQLSEASRKGEGVSRRRNEILADPHLVKLAEQRARLVLVAGISGKFGQRIGHHSNEAIDSQPSRAILDVHLEPWVLVDEQHDGFFARTPVFADLAI
jgi:hypothetical protein